MADLMLAVTYFGILLGLGIFVANLLKKAKIPDTFFLLILGLILGPTVYLNPVVQQYISISLVDVGLMGNIPDFLRILALILVVFTSMFNLGLRAFRRVGNMALNIALAGVVFNTLVMGLVANLIFGFDLVYSFILAAVLAGTGTGVIFAFESALKGARKALNIVKVESILNSPLSVLMPFLLLDILILNSGDVLEPMRYLSTFWMMIAVGAGTGLILGLSVTRIFKGMLKQYTPLMLFSVALITYALAENVGGSGMLAVAVAGLIAGNFMRKRDEEIQNFDDHLSEMLRISVFTLLGAQVTLFLDMTEFLYILIFFLIMFFIRPVFLFPVLGKERKRFSREDFLVMSFITPRGLSAAAMAPIVAVWLIGAGFDAMAGRIMNIIFMVILLSVMFSTIVAYITERKDEKDRKRVARKEEAEHEPLAPEEPPEDVKNPDYVRI
jgi:cell volume regulation protein A